MGSPISSVIAEVVLQQLEHIAMAQYQPKFWARYVDDTFVIIKKQYKTDFMGILNSVYPDIQFTMEEENRGSLAFLDVLIQRQQSGFLETRVYRKTTCTDRILHYESNHPIAHKVSCIKTLFKRVVSHCSTARAKKEERNHLFRICKRNGYPVGFIKRYSIPSEPRSNPSIEEPIPQTTRVTLPYICNVSEATARLLAPFNVKVAHKPSQTLRAAIMRPKDPLPNMEKSAVIYRIDCMDCPSNYVGETSKRVKTRVHEHRLAVRRGEQRSQVWAHMAESGHRFNFNEISVLASDNTKGGRLLKEAWLSNRDSINRHIDLCPAHLALRSWSTDAHPPRCRQSGDVFGIPKRETQKEMLIPQRIIDNPVKEEQHSKNTIAPTVRTRLQKIREAAEIEIRNGGIGSTRDTSAGASASIMNGEVRGQSKAVTTYPHPKRRKKTDSEMLERSPDLMMVSRPELSTRSELDKAQDGFKKDDTQIEKVGEEAGNRFWQENIHGDRTHDSLGNIPPHSVTSILVDSGELQRNCMRAGDAGREGEGRAGSECGGSQGDWHLPPPYPDVNGAWRSHMDDDVRKTRGEREENCEKHRDLMSWPPHPTMLAGRDCGGVGGDPMHDIIRTRNGGWEEGGEDTIRQESVCETYSTNKLNADPPHLTMTTRLNQRGIQDHPKNNNKRVETPRERDDICKNGDWADMDWGERKKGECGPSERLVQTGEEDGGSTKRKKGALSNLKSDEGGTSNTIHTNKRRKKEKPATGSQFTQLGPVTRSRSRAQNLTNL